MGGAEALARLVADELAQPVPEAVTRLAEAIRSRTGAGHRRRSSSTAPVCASAAPRACSTSTCWSMPTATRTPGAGSRSRTRCFRPTCSTSSCEARPGGCARSTPSSRSRTSRGARPGAGCARGSGRASASRCAPSTCATTRREPAVVAACVESVLTLLERALPLLPGEGERIRAERGGALADRLPRDLRGRDAARAARRDRAGSSSTSPSATRGPRSSRRSSSRRAAGCVCWRRGEPLEVELPAGERRRRRRARASAPAAREARLRGAAAQDRLHLRRLAPLRAVEARAAQRRRASCRASASAGIRSCSACRCCVRALRQRALR